MSLRIMLCCRITRKLASAVVVVAWLTTLPVAVNAQITGDRELLRQAALASRANREAILTWQGEAEITTRITGPIDEAGTFTGDWDVTRRSKVTFAFDRAARRHIFLQTQEEESGRKGNAPADGRAPLQWGILRADDTEYDVGHWYVNGKEGHPKRPVMMVQNITNHSTELSTNFNPFHLFDYLQNDPYGLLMMYYEAPKVSSEVTITRSGDLVTLSSKSLGGRSVYVFSLGQSGVLVKLDTGDSAQTTHRTVDREFALVNAVWVPIKSRSVSVNVRNGKRRVTECEINITKQTINRSISPEVFTPIQLGIRKGDKVRDRRTGAEYLYDEETDPLVPRRTPVWVYTAVGGAVLATLLVMLAGWRWRRRAAREVAHVT